MTDRKLSYTMPRDWSPSFPDTSDPDAHRIIHRRHSDGVLEVGIVSFDGLTIEISAYLPGEDKAFTSYILFFPNMVKAFAAPYGLYALADKVVDAAERRGVV